MAKNLVLILIVASFFGNWLVDKNIIPEAVTIITEIVIFLLFVYSLILKASKFKKFYFHNSIYFIFFILCALSSSIINNWYNLQIVYSLRLILRFYIFYLALINIEFNDKIIRKINNFLLVMFVLQLPVSAINFYFYGIAEKTHGLHGRGGGLTTIIPLIIIGFLTGYYLFFKKSYNYIILGILFIFYGIVGAKAALLYLYPLAFITFYYIAFIKGKKIHLIKHIGIIILIVFSSFVVSNLIIKYNPRLNPERRIGGPVDYEYAYWYTKDYSTAKDLDNPSIAYGRLSTSKLAIQSLQNEGVMQMLLGFGPGAITPSIFGYEINKKVENIYKSYGVSGFIYILVEYGIIGVAIIFWIFIKYFIECMKWFKTEKDPYYKAFSFGATFFAFFSIIIFVTYNNLPIAGDIMPLLFFYCMSIMHLKLNRAKLN